MKPKQPARRRNSAPARLATQLGALSVAAPQVIGHRLARMALAGPAPTRRDQREFSRMVTEKMQALQEGWWAMAGHLAGAQQRLWAAWLGGGGQAPALDCMDLTLAVLGKGLQPLRRRATRNARRLANTPLKR